MPDTQQVLKGRVAVDEYRAAHAQLYQSADKKGIPEAHTPLLEKMLAAHKEQGFNSFEEFFTASEDLNAQELGFASKVDFDKEIDRLEKIPDQAKAKGLREALDGKWQ